MSERGLRSCIINRMAETGEHWLEAEAFCRQALGLRPAGSGGWNGVTEDDSFSKIIIGLFILKLAKMPGGLEVIKTLGKEFLRGMFKTLHYLGQASAANPVAAWANPILISAVLDRFGFLKPGFIANYHLGITMISGIDIAEDVTQAILGALPWNFLKGTTPSEFPTSIVYASTSETTE